MNSLELKKALAKLIIDFTKETEVYAKEININWTNVQDGSKVPLSIDLIYEDKKEYLK